MKWSKYSQQIYKINYFYYGGQLNNEDLNEAIKAVYNI